MLKAQESNKKSGHNGGLVRIADAGADLLHFSRDLCIPGNGEDSVS